MTNCRLHIFVLSRFFVIILFLCQIPSLFAYQEIDRPIALVENSPITIRHLEDDLKKQNIPITAESVKQTLEKLINNRLVLEEIKRRNIAINDEKLDQEILNIAKQNNITIKKLFDEMQMNYPGGFKSYREDIRLAILDQEVRNKIIYPKINQLILEGIESQKNESTQTEKQILVQEIMVDGNKNEGYTKIIEAHQKLELGVSFKAVAKIYSEVEPKELRGNIIGWIDESSLDKSRKKIIEELKPHQYSSPEKIENNWLIIKVVNERKIEKKSIEKLRQKIDEQRVNEEYLLWINELKGLSYIEIKNELLQEYLNQLD